MVRIKNQFCFLKGGIALSDIEKNENELLESTENENSVAEEEPLTNEKCECSTEDSDNVNAGDDLTEELEGIRVKFQELLDETAQTYLASGDAQEVDEEQTDSEETEEISEEELCQCCGERKRAAEFGEDYPYCEECRKIMQHSPISFKGIFALICVILLTGVAVFYVFAANASLIDSAVTAEANLRAGKIYSAIENFSQALQPYAPDSSAIGNKAIPKKVAAKYADAYASLLNYNYASSVVNQFFGEKDLKNPVYSRLNSYVAKGKSYAKIMETINNALADEKNGAPEIVKLLEALKSDGENDAFLIEYYEYIVTQYFGEKPENQYEMLSQLGEKYPDEWPVKYELCAICSKLGKAEEAETYLSEVIKHNSEDAAIYAYLADAYRFGEEPNADKMLEVLEKGFEVDGDSGYASTDLNRVKAIAYLLKGDYDSAYDAAAAAYQVAYSSIQYGYGVNNLAQCLYTYQVCAHLKDDKDAYEGVSALFGYIGLDESEDVKSFVKGKTTLEKIITDREGDLS